MRRRSDNTAIIVIGVLASAAACVGILMWGRARASSPPPSPQIEPVGFFPDLKVGDVVLVDAVAANAPAGNLATFVATVDLILSDLTLASVRGNTTDFRGTIPRSSIVRVLPRPAPGDFA